MGFKKRYSAILTPALLLTPVTCFAAAGAEYLKNVFLPGVLNEALIAFWGISAAAVFYYAVRTVIDAHKDEATKELGTSLIHVVTGFAIIACASAFAAAFGVGMLSPDPITDVNPGILDPSIKSIADFIIKMSSGIFILMVVIAGLGMIASQGESSNFDKWRKVLVSNCVGVVMMLTAYFVIHAIADVNSGLLITEIRGLILWILTLIGYICVVALIIAGIFLIVSVDESLKDRAKRIVIGTLISMVILTLSYALIVVFLPA